MVTIASPATSVEQKWGKGAAELKAEGRVLAVFSTFDRVDSDGDVVRPSAFTPGQEVPMVWSHDWQQPIGKGVVRVEPDRAVLDGEFFMDTFAGAEAFKTVKSMGALQEWSWGFRITEATFGEFEGHEVRFIDRAEVFEVSPVLVGANRSTETLAIKGRCPSCGKDADTNNAEPEPEAGKQAEGWEEQALADVLGAIEREDERLAVDIT